MWHRLFSRLIPPLCLSNEYGVTEQSASLAINYILSRGPHKPTNMCAYSVWRAEILMINEKRRGSYYSSGLPTSISPREFYLDLLQYLPRSLTKVSIWQDHAWMPLDWLWSLHLSFLFLGDPWRAWECLFYGDGRSERERTSQCQAHFKPLSTSSLLMSHWPEQVTWLRPRSRCGRVTLPMVIGRCKVTCKRHVKGRGDELGSTV